MSPSNTFIQAIVKTDKPMVNSNVEIEVNSTHPLKYLSYEIIGRGDILNAGSIHVSDKHIASFRYFMIIIEFIYFLY